MSVYFFHEPIECVNSNQLGRNHNINLALKCVFHGLGVVCGDRCPFEDEQQYFQHSEVFDSPMQQVLTLCIKM